ncbi:hypothetical protein EYF80_038543 [Liparis tanakae]|uniref:Uncharacterized protein n=1 Tax=Liparis tanakae TaxID=230148 RepID=A0A4Z2GEA4_9TELE|nr:hypothetical protein EYF80_038543 [Liparis tanakae]
MEEGSEESEGGASPLASTESSCMEPAASFTALLSSEDTRGDSLISADSASCCSRCSCSVLQTFLWVNQCIF